MISERQPTPDIFSDPEVAKAAVIENPGEVLIKEVSLPDPGPGEVRIKLEGSGLCASNIPVWEGRDWFQYPLPHGNPGHEGWGIIDAIGTDVTGFALKDRVTGLTYNAYADYDIAKQENIVKLPDFFDGKPFPGEPLGCAMNIFDRSDIKEGQTVAVVGCGFLGLLLVQLLKSAGCKIIAISRRDFSLEKAKSFGADYTIPLDDHHKIIEKVNYITEGNFCDRTIECTGKEWPLNLSIEITGIRGKLIVAGFHQDGMRSLNVQMLNWRGIDMISAHERDNKEYIKGIKKAIEAIQIGKMNPYPLLTHVYSLEDIAKGFKDLIKRPDGFIKAIIVNGDGQ